MRIGVLAFVLVGWGGCGKGESPNLQLSDDNNFTYTADMDLLRVPLQAGADFTLEWPDLTVDLRGRPLDPTAVDQVALTDFTMTEDVLIDRILVNDIPQAEGTSFLKTTSGETAVSLGDFSVVGNQLDVTIFGIGACMVEGAEGPEALDPDVSCYETADCLAADPAATCEIGTHTWLMTLFELGEGQAATEEVLQTVIVEPAVASDTHLVTVANGVSSITVDADLHSAPPLKTVADAGPYTLDWSSLEEDVNGRAFDNLTGNNLLIAHYDGDITSVEDDFLLLDYHAEALYELDVFGKTDAQLDEAKSADGKAFPGFTADGTWLVAITCETCLSPLPLVIAVVEVAPE